jgi:hypothetical protein
MFKLSNKATKCIAFGLALNLVGCQTNVMQEIMPQSRNISGGRTEETIRSYSGEELFRGIFFFQGIVSEKVAMYSQITSLLKNADAKVLAARNEIANDIFNDCQKLYPEYLVELENSVKTKNFYAIEQCLYKGNKILEILILQNPKYSEQIKFAKAKVESLDLKNYDLENQESRNKFLQDLNKSYQSDNGLSNTTLSGDVNGTCLFFAAVVAVALWNSVAAVNVAVVLNVVGAVFAAIKSYDDVWSRGGGGGGKDKVKSVPPYMLERNGSIDVLVAQIGELN